MLPLGDGGDCVARRSRQRRDLQRVANDQEAMGRSAAAIQGPLGNGQREGLRPLDGRYQPVCGRQPRVRARWSCFWRDRRATMRRGDCLSRAERQRAALHHLSRRRVGGGKFNAAAAHQRYRFVTDPVARDGLMAHYRHLLPDVTIVLLHGGARAGMTPLPARSRATMCWVTASLGQHAYVS
jgi:hypothetical protein